MLEYAIKQRSDVVARMYAIQAEMLRLQGAKAALDDVIEHARTAEAGGGAPVAPAPVPYPTEAVHQHGPAAVTQAIKVGHGPLQADEELRE